VFLQSEQGCPLKRPGLEVTFAKQTQYEYLNDFLD